MKLKALIKHLQALDNLSWMPEDADVEVEVLLGREPFQIKIVDVATRNSINTQRFWNPEEPKAVLVMQ